MNQRNTMKAGMMTGRRPALHPCPAKGLAFDYFQATKKTYEHVINDYPNSIRNKSLFITYSIGGEVGVIFYWLRNGCQESPEEIAENLLANTVKLQR